MILLSDGYLANGSEPWRLPDLSTLPEISVPFADRTNHVNADGTEEFWPYLRDPETLARPWAVPGTPGLMHRVGGIEKEDGSGNISYDPDNHEQMVRLRAAKVAGIAHDIPPIEVAGDADADVCVLGWGSTWGAISAGVRRAREHGHKRRLGAPHPPEPAAERPRRRAATVPAGDRARAELGAPVPPGARRVPGGRPVPVEDAGLTVHGRRDPASDR